MTPIIQCSIHGKVIGITICDHLFKDWAITYFQDHFNTTTCKKCFNEFEKIGYPKDMSFDDWATLEDGPALDKKEEEYNEWLGSLNQKLVCSDCFKKSRFNKMSNAVK